MFLIFICHVSFFALYMQTAKALVSLHICGGCTKPLLIDNTISSKMTCTDLLKTINSQAE